MFSLRFGPPVALSGTASQPPSAGSAPWLDVRVQADEVRGVVLGLDFDETLVVLAVARVQLSAPTTT
jgi:hypothetical protein